MTDVPQHRIGHYEIIRELGRGGMGVVFLGRDTRLDRMVAIKALPPEVASHPAALERFEREAKTLAGLHHPNIASIYGVEEQDGAKYLVLDFIDGETLADRIDRGPIRVDEALELAIQIAAGVEAAHEAGVIHRDLKPGNIIVTPEGKATILDFGLARFDEGASSTIGTSESSTIRTLRPQHSPTMAGAILGTAAYMSPEQARGRRVDKRTDIWSFGVVVYEMLVGSSPFRGETATDTIGAVLHKAFTIDDLPAGTPWMVRHVLQRCLERDKSRRLQSIGDVRIELEDALKRLESGERDERGAAASGRGAWIWPSLAACFAVTTVAGVGLWWAKSPAPNDAAEPTVEPAPRSATPSVVSVQQVTDSLLGMMGASLAPDASTVAYAARGVGRAQDVFTLRIGGANPLDLTRNPEAFDAWPVFSPDGESIAFVHLSRGDASGGIYVMGATGESPRRIVESPCFNPAWSPDGRSLVYTTAWWTDVYGRSAPGALWVVDLATRERRRIDTTDPAVGPEVDDWASDAVSPAWSPDGTRFAYWGLRGGTRDIFTVSANGGDLVRITDDVHTDWNPVWSPDGRAIWFLSDRGGQAGLWSIALDDAGRAAGAPRPIMLGTGAISSFSRAADGRSLVVRVNSGRDLVERVRFDPETERFVGTPEPVLASSSAISNPDISHDGAWIAFHSAPPLEDITVMRLDGTGRRRLTEGTAKDRSPRWSPDGRTLFYQSNQNGDYQLWTVDRDSAEARVRPIAGVPAVTGLEISNDGTRIAFNVVADQPLQLANLAADGSVTEVRSAPEGFRDPGQVRWSPDDRRIKAGWSEPNGFLACTILDLETNTLIQVHKPNGEVCGFWAAAAWIDATRLLVQEGDAAPAFIFDVVTGAPRRIDDSPTGMGSFVALRADGWLYTKRSEDLSNLWLVTLDDPGAE